MFGFAVENLHLRVAKQATTIATSVVSEQPMTTGTWSYPVIVKCDPILFHQSDTYNPHVVWYYEQKDDILSWLEDPVLFHDVFDCICAFERIVEWYVLHPDLSLLTPIKWCCKKTALYDLRIGWKDGMRGSSWEEICMMLLMHIETMEDAWETTCSWLPMWKRWLSVSALPENWSMFAASFMV